MFLRKLLSQHTQRAQQVVEMVKIGVDVFTLCLPVKEKDEKENYQHKNTKDESFYTNSHQKNTDEESFHLNSHQKNPNKESSNRNSEGKGKAVNRKKNVCEWCLSVFNEVPELQSR